MPAISFMFQGVGLSDVDLKGLFLKHAATLRGYLARKVRDPQLAADLVQESFLRLAEQTRGERIDNSQGYLYRTANNLLIDHVRQEARRKTETVPHEVLADIEDEAAGLEAQAMAQQQVSGEFFGGYWADIGTPERLQQAESKFLMQQSSQLRDDHVG